MRADSELGVAELEQKERSTTVDRPEQAKLLEEGSKERLYVLGKPSSQVCSCGFLNALVIRASKPFSGSIPDTACLKYTTRNSFFPTIQVNHSVDYTIRTVLISSLGLIIGVLVDVVRPRKLPLPTSILTLRGILMLSLGEERRVPTQSC